MLVLQLLAADYYDENKGRFITRKPRKVMLEHSLVSLSRWESKWKESFLSNKKKTREQSLDYIRFMSTSGVLDDETLSMFGPKEMATINEYIEDKMTATTIKRRGPAPHSRDIITAEVIYWWMIQYGIPMECEKWHLNRLLTLIEVCSVKSGPQQKMSRQEEMAQRRMLNASRKAHLNTKG